jgi:hypothetical protein
MPNEMPCYKAGRWETAPDPLAGLPDGADVEEELRRRGYESCFEFGTDHHGMMLQAWQRSKIAPHWFVQVTDSHSTIHEVLADGLPDALDLLGRWAPLVTAWAAAGSFDHLDRVIRNGDESARAIAVQVEDEPRRRRR